MNSSNRTALLTGFAVPLVFAGLLVAFGSGKLAAAQLLGGATGPDAEALGAPEDVPWGPQSPLYALTYDSACPSGAVRGASGCVPVAEWLADRGFASVCVVDAEGGGDATTIAGCGYAEGRATVVRAGTYREDVRPTTDRFALVAYPGERPVVSGADVAAPGGWTHQGGGVWRHPWTWVAQDNGNGRTSAGRRRELFVVGGAVLRARGGDTRPALADGQFWVEGRASAPTAVYLDPPGDADPNAEVVEVGQRWQLFWPADATRERCGSSQLEGLLVAGLTFRHGTSNRQRFAVCLGAADGAILDADIGWQSGGGLDLAGKNHLATGNRIHDNGIEGVGGTRADDVVVAFNEVARNGWADPDGTGHGGAGKFTRSRGLVVRNNVVSDNEVNGLWLDISNRNAVVAANLFARNANTGVFLELFSDSSLVANNLCVGNRLRTSDPPGRARLAGCIRLADASANVVAFNTVVGASNAALMVLADDRSLWPCGHDGDPACGPDEAPSGQNTDPADERGRPVRSRGNVFLNNVLLAIATEPYTNGAGRRVRPRASAIRVAVPGHAEGSVWGGNVVGAPGGAAYSTLAVETSDPAVWVAATGEQGGGAVAGPLAVLLDTASAAGMLQLAAGSPARGAAVPVPETVYARFDPGRRRDAARYHLTHDVWGRPRRVPADAGAGGPPR